MAIRNRNTPSGGWPSGGNVPARLRRPVVASVAGSLLALGVAAGAVLLVTYRQQPSGRFCIPDSTPARLICLFKLSGAGWFSAYRGFRVRPSTMCLAIGRAG